MSYPSELEYEALQISANRIGSNALLAAMVREHGRPYPVQVEIKEDPNSELLETCSQLRLEAKELKDRIGDLQAIVERQRKIIIRFGESDDLEIPKFSEILQVVCEHYNITKVNITSASRAPRYSLPRQVAYYLARRLTKLSLPEIGRRSFKDHTSVLYGANKIEEMLKTNVDLRQVVNTLTLKIGAKVAARNVIIGEERDAA